MRDPSGLREPAEVTVDVVIPVHTTERPLARAVRSVLATRPRNIRVIVVAHGIAPESLSPQLDAFPPDLVRTVHHVDGIPSLAGPANAGIRASEAEYICRLDSDDEIEPGAIENWRRQAVRHDADLVLARLRLVHKPRLDFPHVRPGRIHDLDVVEDRLFYRSVPFGLIRRRLLEEHRIEAAEGLRPAEDQPMMARAMIEARRIELAAPDAGAHVMHDDQPDRIQHATFPASAVLAGVRLIVESDWFVALPRPTARSLGVKMLRRVLIPAVSSATVSWDAAQTTAAAGMADALLHQVPAAFETLARQEQNVVTALREAASIGAESAAVPAAPAGRWSALRTRSWRRDVLDRESPLRHAVVEYTGNRFLGRFLER